MRPSALAVASLMIGVLLGCGGDSPTSPAPVYPKSGHWELTAVAGRALPYDAGPWIDQRHLFIVSGYIDVAPPCCSYLFEVDSLAGDASGSGGVDHVEFDADSAGVVHLIDLSTHGTDVGAVTLTGDVMAIGSASYHYAGPIQPAVTH